MFQLLHVVLCFLFTCLNMLVLTNLIDFCLHVLYSVSACIFKDKISLADGLGLRKALLRQCGLQKKKYQQSHQFY